MIFIGIVVVLLLVNAEPDVFRDYCEKDTFSTKCSEDDEVAVIQHASYGRMKIGTCLTSGYGSLGCSVDILHHLDQLCSGRATCSFNVRDLLNFNPCPEDLRGYLEIMYTCVKVNNPVHSSNDKSICLSTSKSSSSSPTDIFVNNTKDSVSYLSRGVKVSFSYSGVISNYMTEVTNCGGLDHPWSVRAQPGQRINITIVDFSGLETNGNDKSWKNSGLCQVFANIQDKTVGTTETICADEPRIRHAYLSVSHHVEIRVMVRSNKAEPAIYALLFYHVVGCSDTLEPSPSKRRWFKKLSSERAVLGCVDSREVYELTCAVNEWKGSDVNCSSGGFTFTSGFLSGKHLSVEDKIVLTIIVTCLIGLLVLIGGILIVKRKMASRLSREVQRHQMTSPHDETMRQQQLLRQQQQLIYAQKLQPYSPQNPATTPLTTIKTPTQGLPPQGYPFVHDSAIDCYFRRQVNIPPVLTKQHLVTSQACLIDDPSYNKLISDHIYESPKSVRREVERLMEERDKMAAPVQAHVVTTSGVTTSA